MSWGRRSDRYESFYPPYVSAAEKRLRAQKAVEKQMKKGSKIHPIIIEGRQIANTFWGKSWCENLERYSDYENRLPRGRSYVRNGSVIDLHIEKGEINAQVSGTNLYKIKIGINPLLPKKWKAIKSACSGHIGSLIELLRGKFSKNIMEIICRKGEGMFPEPSEIKLDCSCPDWADMCKHVAAVLYGVGARLDENPELIFLLRNVDHLELISQAAVAGAEIAGKATGQSMIAESDIADVFGIEIEKGDATTGEDKKTAKPKKAVPRVKKSAKKRTRKKSKVAQEKSRKKKNNSI